MAFLTQLQLMVILNSQKIKNKWKKCYSNYNQYLKATLLIHLFTVNFKRERGKWQNITDLSMRQTVVYIASFPSH